MTSTGGNASTLQSTMNPKDTKPAQCQTAGPFTAQRIGFAEEVAAGIGEKLQPTESDEWDASKTVPSRFQQRKGSVHATPASRDGHVDRNAERDAAFHLGHAKLLSKSWAGKMIDKITGGGGSSESRRKIESGRSSADGGDSGGAAAFTSTTGNQTVEK